MNANTLEQIPAGWLSVGGTLGAVFVACVIHALVQRRYGEDKLKDHNEVAGVILTVVGTLYSVILGFVVVVVWQGFTEASNVGDHEANGLAYVYRLSDGLPEPTRSSIRADIRSYTASVLNSEWPRMIAGGKSDPKTAAMAERVSSELIGFQPKTPAQTNLQATALLALGQFLDDRRDRLTYLDSRIPAILWGVLIFGGVIILALAFLIGVGNKIVQLTMTAALAAMIAITLITILELDSPLEGATHVEPVAWQIFEEQLQHAPQEPNP